VPGGKLREIAIADARLDAGPTVFTLRGVFDQLFADAGDDLDQRLKLVPARLLARHAWNADARLDLYADLERTIEAIGTFAGLAEARAFMRFAADAKRMYRTLDRSFMAASRPSPVELVRRVGLCGRRSASTSPIHGCVSCSAAMRPIAVPRRSARRPP
jgi:1-hydroxycarotenoid 3,4-desaturase